MPRHIVLLNAVVTGIPAGLPIGLLPGLANVEERDAESVFNRL
jgi:hypothetical protein